jgi:hypothetical protein
MKLRASESIEPHDGAGGCTPSPRNESAASTMIAVERLNVACTMIGAVTFGRISRTITRRSRAPSARAAWTNSRCVRESTLPRTTREKIGM